MAPGQIRVNIFGTEYSLVSEDNESYIREIARYLDEKMRKIDQESSITSSSKISVLAALNVIDELFQERKYKEKLFNQINEEAKKINHSIVDFLEE
jgi:cell division protein ZapA